MSETNASSVVSSYLRRRSFWVVLFTLCCSIRVLGGAEEIPPLNKLVLWAISTMPSGVGYDASQQAVDRLAASVTVSKDGKTIEQDLSVAKANFCSGATYLVFLRVIEELRSRDSLKLLPKVLARYAHLGVADGEEIFGRWNANGPGTAKLFAELRCGTNFTSYEKARPGDFMKMWWSNEIGSKERGHLVVYLGKTILKGKEAVRFWSSNNPDGYGVKTVPKTRIKRVLFSRLDKYRRLKDAGKLSPKNVFLADMLRKPFTWDQVVRECRVSEK